MFYSKSQSSMEFLVILGIGLTMIIIFAGIFFTYSSEAKIEMDKTQIETIGNNLITNIEKIYFMGYGNQYLYKTNFPKNFINLTIHHINNSNSTNEIYFDYLNMTYMVDKRIISSIFTTKEDYIRFNCSLCNHTINIGGNWTSYYGSYTKNDSALMSWGPKEIEIKSKGDYVLIDFMR